MTERSGHLGTGRRGRWLAGAAAMVCFVALAAMLLSSRLRVESDLRVVAPRSAVPGQPLPVRVLVYEGVDAIEGPTLTPARAHARLCDLWGRCGAAQLLHTGLGPSLEGVLQVPKHASEALMLRVAAQLQADHFLRVQAVVRVVAPNAAATMPSQRPLRALQQLAHGPLQRKVPLQPGDAGRAPDLAPSPTSVVAPPELRIVVGGGVCVPEQVCELFGVAAGEVRALSIEGNAAVTLLPGAERSVGIDAGLLVQRVRVHGPEAAVGLSALRPEGVRDRRQVRLPVALGALTLHPGPRLAVAGVMPHLQVASLEPGPCIVDTFVAGCWIDTFTVDQCERSFQLPRPLQPGITRLQVRRDPFSEQGAAVRVIASAPAGAQAGAAQAALRAVAGPELRERLHIAPGQPRGPLALDDSTWGTVLAAQLEDGLIPLPSPLSDYAQAQAELLRHKRQLRLLSLLSIAAAGAAVVLLVGHTGVRGGAQLDALLAAAGSEAKTVARERRHRRWALLLVLLSLCLSFFAIGLYVAIRHG